MIEGVQQDENPTLIAALSLIASAATPISAAVVYESAGYPNTFGVVTVSGPDNSKEGFRQVATLFNLNGGDVFLDAVSIVAVNFGSQTLNSFDIAVFSDSAGAPGTSLETIAGISLPASEAIETTAFAGTTVLQSGVDYWIVLTGNGDANGEWYDTDASPVSPNASRTSPGGSWSVASTPPRVLTLQVEGTSVPEPSSPALLGLGGLVVCCCRRR